MKSLFSNFSTRPSIYIQYRDSSLGLIVRAQGKVRGAVVKEFSKVALSGGIVDNPELLGEALQKALKDVATYLRKENNLARLVVPESLSFTHLFAFGGSQGLGALPKNIRKEAAEIIPLPFDQLYADWVVLGEQKDGPISVLLAAIPREALLGHLKVLELVKAKPGVVETEMIALPRVLLPDDAKVTAILDIGARSTKVGIFDDKTRLPKLSITVPIAGNAFSEALMVRLKINKEEAERLKREEGFDVNKGKGWTLVILQERVQAILRELEKAFHYYETTFGKKIERVVLAGGSALMPSLQAYLAANLAREVLVGDPEKNFGQHISTLFPKDTQLLLWAPLLGLALRPEHPARNEKTLNLLSGWLTEHSLIHQAVTLRIWRYLGVVLFVSSILWSGYIIYSSLYEPLIVYKKEALERIQPTTPFYFSEELSGDETGDTPPPSNVVTPDETTPAIPTVRILETPTGWLNVRGGPGTTYPIVKKLYPEESYPLLKEEGGWVQISFTDGSVGWVVDDYIQKYVAE